MFEQNCSQRSPSWRFIPCVWGCIVHTLSLSVSESDVCILEYTKSCLNTMFIVWPRICPNIRHTLLNVCPETTTKTKNQKRKCETVGEMCRFSSSASCSFSRKRKIFFATSIYTRNKQDNIFILSVYLWFDFPLSPVLVLNNSVVIWDRQSFIWIVTAPI